MIMNPEKYDLTEKQRRSLPIIAAARTVHAGVEECIEAHVFASHEQFYNRWIKQPHYVKALNIEREKVQGEITERIKQIMIVYAESIAIAMVDAATQNSYRPEQQRAREACLAIIGLDTGRGNRQSVTINQQIAEKQASFQDRFEARLESRHRRINGRDLQGPLGGRSED